MARAGRDLARGLTLATFIRGEHLRDQLTDPPEWLDAFVAHVAGTHCVSRAWGFVTDLGRRLEDEH